MLAKASRFSDFIGFRAKIMRPGCKKSTFRARQWPPSLPAALLLLSLVAHPQMAVCSPQDYIAGMDAYNRRDYVAAKKCFANMVKDTPEDSLGHYNLANTLVSLKDTAGAISEYKIAMENADSDDVRNNCQAALKRLEKPDPKGKKGALAGAKNSTVTGKSDQLKTGSVSTDSTASAASGTSASGLNAAGASSAGSGSSTATTGKATAAVNGVPEVTLPDMRTPMQKQADDRKSSVSQQSESQQKAILDAAKAQAARIKAEHDADANNLIGRRRGYYQDQIKKEGTDQAKSVMDHATKQAGEYKKYVDEKAAALNDVVNNLDSQMNTTGGASKIHLKREGTNINVRNYEFSH